MCKWQVDGRDCKEDRFGLSEDGYCSRHQSSYMSIIDRKIGRMVRKDYPEIYTLCKERMDARS